MRGELDADHGFRALDYWAREQRNDESDREHRPVIVAERIRGTRHWTLLETLAEKLGLVALEIRCINVEGKPVQLDHCDAAPVRTLLENSWKAL